MVGRILKYSDQLVKGIITLGDNLFHEMRYVRLYNQKATLRVERFIDNFNEVFKNEDEDLIITFQRKELKDDGTSVKKLDRKWKVTFEDKEITEWIVKTLRSSITRNQISIDIGPQLFNTYMTGRIEDKKYVIYQQNIEGIIYERKDEDEIINETISSFTIPLLQYLNTMTKLKTKPNQDWTLPQLGFVLEVLIALGFYTSRSGREFVFGSSKPTVGDKKYLQTTLNNKIKQGFIDVKSGTQA